MQVEDPLADCTHDTVTRAVVDGVEEWRCNGCYEPFTRSSKLDICEKNGQHIHDTLTASLRDANAALMTVAALLGVGDVGLGWKERLFEKAKEAKDTASRLDSTLAVVRELLSWCSERNNHLLTDRNPIVARAKELVVEKQEIKS